jgi:integrase
MRELTSQIAPLIREYVSYRQASGRWSDSYAETMGLFDKHCKTNYPDVKELTQPMVDDWCVKRETESNNSCRRRIHPISSFILFLQKRDMTAVVIPPMPRFEVATYIPHAFTADELTKFFNACDTLPYRPSKQDKSRRLTLPVFFRLLYSSGIRTNEARLLRRNEVDLVQGVLNIKYSKGHTQHFVVLHDSMLQLMQLYDTAITGLYSNRTYFFPTGVDSHHTSAWVSTNFKKMWFQSNSAYAVPYELRHNYAVENINKWTDDGFEFNAKLLYLSKSMGHSSIESTKYYYSLVPRLADILTAHSNEDEVIPEVPL